MKTAEEWADQHCIHEKPLHPWADCSVECEGREENLVAYVKQIQLDAMKEGMRRAANELANNEHRLVRLKDGTIANCDCIVCAIHTAAEQLILKDL